MAEKSKRDSDAPPPSSERSLPGADRQAGNTREKIESLGKKKGLYPMGERFDMEAGKEHLSKGAADFLREHPIMQEVLKDLYEYDACSYIHTVQMLNEGVAIMNENGEAIKDLIIKKKRERADTRFDFPEEEFRVIFLGAIVFHDWGKIKVDSGILNAPERLKGKKLEQMRKHPMETLKLLVSRILGKPRGEGVIASKATIADVLSQTGFSEKKGLLQIAYAAVSHHRYEKSIKGGFDYPSLAEIEAILPDYQEWFNAYGEELATVLAILDINDAMRSKRPYKEGLTKEGAEGELEKTFLISEENKTKYGTTIATILEQWRRMTGANKYTAQRDD